MSDLLKNRFISEISRHELEEKEKYVCGDCKFFKKSKCPIGVSYKLADVCYFYKASKKQRKFLKKIKSNKSNKVLSLTKYDYGKRKQKLKSKSRTRVNNRIITKDGFIKCSLRYAFRTKAFIEKIIERESWKCRRSRCKDKQKFVIKVKHPTRSYRINEDLIYTITDVFIEFKLVCLGCNFFHNFPNEFAKEIKIFIKDLKQRKIFTKAPETKDQAQLMTRYVSQIVFPDGFENDPLYSTYKGTLGYKSFSRNIKKISKKNDIEFSKVIGLIFNKAKGCLVLEDASFVIIPGTIFSFAVA